MDVCASAFGSLRKVASVAMLCAAVAYMRASDRPAWLLVRPPIDAEGARILEPLSRWHAAGGFASAREWVAELLLLRVVIYDREEDAGPEERATWWAAANAVEAARCVPAEEVDRDDGPPLGRGHDETVQVLGPRRGDDDQRA